MHGRVIHFIGILVGGTGEVRWAGLAAVIQEDGQVDVRIDIDSKDVGLNGGAEANGGIKVHESM